MTQFARRGSTAVLVLASLSVLAGAGEPVKKKDAVQLAAEIDRLITVRWDKEKTNPAGAAPDAEFLRRIYLDLAGQVPPITEVRDFLDDPSKDKRSRLIDRLLDGDRHVVHWAAVGRAMLLPGSANDPTFGRGSGFETWLRKKVKDNTGFDKIARELVLGGTAGDQGPAAFYQAAESLPENLAAATSRLFLGVKLECAQCHDHPFAEWKKDQFWAMAAFFAGVARPGQTVDRGKSEIAIPGTDKVVKARFLDGKVPALKAGTDARVALADWLTTADNPYFARNAANRVWEYFLGTGLIDPVDEPNPDNPPTHPELLDELARQLAAHDFDLRYLTRAITLSNTYQLTSRINHESQLDARLFARMMPRSMTPEQLYDSLTESAGLTRPERDGRFPADGGQARRDFLARFPVQEKRTESATSILQALYLMNGKFMADATSPTKNKFLGRIADGNTSTARKVDELYMLALSRRPSPSELDRLVKYIDKGGPSGDPRKAMSDVFWALLNSAEFFLNH